jgi:hypothetical protein
MSQTEDQAPTDAVEAGPAAESSDSDPKRPSWKHNQKVSFEKVVPFLEDIKGRVQDLIQVQKKELNRLVGVRDSIQKR